MQKSKFQLDSVAFIGRTLEEYRRFFLLDEFKLEEMAILDCPGGGSSFTAEVNAQKNIAIDPLYNGIIEEMVDLCRKDMQLLETTVQKNQDLFNWNIFYKNLEKLQEYRQKSFGVFIEDYSQNQNNYIQASLPNSLPFADKEFDLALSSHLLFLYSNLYDYEFHFNSIIELMRVSKELRIYPIIDLNFKTYDKLEKLTSDLETKGFRTEIRNTDFNFMKGADQLMIIKA